MVGHDEHVHGRDVCRVVTKQKVFQLATALVHCWVIGDGRLRDLEAELEQFAADARRSTKQGSVVHPHQPVPSEGRGREFESRRVRQTLPYSSCFIGFLRCFAERPQYGPQ